MIMLLVKSIRLDVTVSNWTVNLTEYSCYLADKVIHEKLILFT